MSRLTACTYVIAVHDLQSSAAYYQGTLGFTVREIGDDGWRMFEKDQCRIMAGQCSDALPPKQLGDHAYFAYLTVDGMDEYYAQVQANGGRIVKRLRDEPWGMREFALETIHGHRIMFGGSVRQRQ